MRYIGSKLKRLRHELGLTQTEMAAGVISVSFYSKVERGYHDIGAEELIEILRKHNISFQEFFSEETKENANKKKVNLLMNQLVKAANEDNDSEIDKIINEFENISPQTTFIESLILQAKIISNTHDKHSLESLSAEDKKKIKQLVFQKDTDENDYLRIVLISNVIQIYNIDEATFLINSIIRRYHNVTEVEKRVVVALSVLMINYIDLCFQRNKSNLCQVAINYIKKLPNIIELTFSKILGKYYEDIIHNNEEEASKIKEVLIIAGYDVNVKRMAN
ncbi:helix-turn-helix transcriptional regulator [Lactobacillus sp.]|uniref:helix-turn-helix domain-containing protein n=1 Tax=Lactobacillus sp. TaxID=1591 RepID=UPI0025E2C8AE|nr:helix-turn-helix transcriptional regulator [Lactobacillus sp.]MCO6533001.1 helix-turn-helix domain-containing protein [Lactobacillus sp.]